MLIFWEGTPYGLVNRYFTLRSDVSEELSTHTSTLNMEAV
jgi:hypothetical protein